VQGPGQPTLPLYVFGSIRRGITPQINAIASLILLVTMSVLSVAYVLWRRQARQAGATNLAKIDEPSMGIAAPIGGSDG